MPLPALYRSSGLQAPFGSFMDQLYQIKTDTPSRSTAKIYYGPLMIHSTANGSGLDAHVPAALFCDSTSIRDPDGE
jgi:hypothetical protein